MGKAIATDELRITLTTVRQSTVTSWRTFISPSLPISMNSKGGIDYWVHLAHSQARGFVGSTFGLGSEFEVKGIVELCLLKRDHVLLPKQQDSPAPASEFSEERW